ncbi:hypothetical protein PYW07_007126 [Mythimna separata]|uniref:Uncharacterized protein n=1 Tax=Mythimna separata TaxID=271217 RepID=A0AAD8E166_MYTSE|nr:hypothetical protein PYW07_007126 [Mythimna separata]
MIVLWRLSLDRSLSYKKNCENIKQKVHTRNNLLRHLTSTRWGASLRTTGMALCFSAGEYASPVWSRSAHSNLVDTALIETCRIATGCLKPTSVRMLYPLIGIVPPEIRRAVASRIERVKQQNDACHNHSLVPLRLKSRNS